MRNPRVQDSGGRNEGQPWRNMEERYNEVEIEGEATVELVYSRSMDGYVDQQSKYEQIEAS